MRDPKEVWQDFYDEAKENGMTDDEAEASATERQIDYFAALADYARDRAKERGL